jgi:hypothetical protein
MAETERMKIVAHIEEQLSAAPKPAFDSMKDYDLYEVYVFFLAIAAARQEKATVEFRTQTNDVAEVLRFRTSPGSIYQRRQVRGNSNLQADYSHAVLTFEDKGKLELHLGIYVVGSSGVLHECDVALLESGAASVCRDKQVEPTQDIVLASAECKCYSKGLTIGLGRGFVGLNVDAPKIDMCFVANHQSTSISQYLRHSKKHYFMPVRTTEPKKEKALIKYFRRAILDFQLRPE